ncbi:MAG: serine hydrolase [Cyanobacteria bacterium P01_A01_bin.3]
MRNDRFRHTRQSGDRRRRSPSPDLSLPVQPNSLPPDPYRDRSNFHSSHPSSDRSRDLDPREFAPRPYPTPDLDSADRHTSDLSLNDSSHIDRSTRERFPHDRHPEARPLKPQHSPQNHLHQNHPHQNLERPTPARPQPPRDRTPLRPQRLHRSVSPSQAGPPQAGSFHPAPTPDRPHAPTRAGAARQRPSRKRRKSRSNQSSPRKRQHNSWQAIAFQGFILSVALGLFCGLIARWWGAALSTLPDANGPTLPVSALAPSTFIAPSDPTTRPGSPIDELNQALEALDTQYPDLQLGTVLVDISQRNYAGLRAQEAFPAASTIKLAVLAAVLESVDDQKIALTEKLTLHPAAIAEGSGTLSSQAAGTEVSVLKAAEMMIATSDNTATNLLIERLGGIEVLNQRFLQWNLQHTTLVNPLPDRGGENTSSPADFALLLGEIERGEILEMSSRDRFLDILSTTRNDSLLPQSLQEGDRIAHKTGTIDSVLGDVGLIDLPNGQRYIAAVMVRRTNNDSDAQDVIREVSRLARTYWSHDES